MNTTLFLALLLAQDALDTKSLDQALDDAAAVKPGDAAAYAAARDRVLAFGPRAVDALKERGAADRWTAAGWVRACVAESCRLRLEKPGLAAEADAPRGLDPANYSTFRRPAPECLRDFAHRKAEIVPLLVERGRWTLPAFKVSAGEPGKLERDALLDAIVQAPGLAGDGRAKPFLLETLNDGAAAEGLRAHAAVSYAMAGGAIADLTKALDDARQPETVRAACARALGRIPDAAALDAIRARLDGAAGEVRRGLLTALGILGSAGGWDARGKDSAALGDAIRRGCADTLVAALKTAPEEGEIIGRGLAMTAWPDSVAALKTLSSDAGASQGARDAAKAALPLVELAVGRRGR
jgi:hypothetical protein